MIKNPEIIEQAPEGGLGGDRKAPQRILYESPKFCAVAEEGRLVEYIPRQEDSAGEILLGKVDRLMPSLSCAFVDIGRKQAGFLPLRENSATFTGPPLKSGLRIPVQVRREETGKKGAFLSRDLALPGALTLLMPMNRHIGVSSRIVSEESRARLKALGAALAADRFGLVLRTAAETAPEEVLRQEVESLWSAWQEAEARLDTCPCPGVLLPSLDPADQLLQDYAPRGDLTRQSVESLPPSLAAQLRQALGRTVPLPHGGTLVFDRCEALWAVDVNTASADLGRDRRQTILRTNLEACHELAVQLRLRNAAGILIVDFIDMDDESDRQTVLQELTQSLSRDPRKTVIHGWTRLGLMEITRKRTRPPLEETYESN